MKRLVLPLLLIFLSPLALVPLTYTAINGFLALVSGPPAPADTQWLAALTTASFTAVASVWLVIYNAQRSREQADREMNRSKKAEAYNRFLTVLTSVMNSAKSRSRKATKTGAANVPPSELVESMTTLMTTVMVYGSPEVINAFAHWREVGATTDTSQTSGSHIVSEVDALLRAIRTDLGESNDGLPRNTLMGLLVIGGKRELDRAIAASKLPHRTTA